MMLTSIFVIEGISSYIIFLNNASTYRKENAELLQKLPNAAGKQTFGFKIQILPALPAFDNLPNWFKGFVRAIALRGVFLQ